MEFFHEPKIDWMGKKWYFIVLSLVLLGAGIAAIAAHGGILYGIDFRGGTLVYVKFAKQPNLDGIRAELRKQNRGEATIQRFGPAADNEVIIGLDLKETSSAEALDAGKRAIVTALGSMFGAGPEGKLDFNNASPQTVSEHLVADDPLRLASQGTEVAMGSYRDLSEAIVGFRNSPPRSGLIADFQQLTAVPGVTPAVVETLAKDFYLSSFAVRNTEIVGPKVGTDLRRQALYVTLAGLGAMLVYIWVRFELIYGVAAVIAVFHDVLITIGIFSLLKEEISLTVIAALLTLVGYSMNDTIVIFDRVRENIHISKRENFIDLVNRSINQTLSRTILTSGLTLLAVLSLYLFGGEVIHGFALALVVGVIIGTYSSIAIASPILVGLQERFGKTGVGEKPRVLDRQTAGARR
ncbi:MAG TPA: protein translocase subunit SecF [Terriglobia bacterium]|nr:protein translocase subunit SecF [Terriglobia bacterium]